MRWVQYMGLDLLDVGRPLDLMDIMTGLRLCEINGNNSGLRGFKMSGGITDSPVVLFNACYSTDKGEGLAAMAEAYDKHLKESGLYAGLGFDPEGNEACSPLEALLADKVDQRFLHPPTVTPWATFEPESIAALLEETNATHFVVKPRNGIQGNFIRIVPRACLYEVVDPSVIIEPLLVPKGRFARALRTGVAVIRNGARLDVCHLASYWRVSRCPFDPGNPGSVIVNLSLGALPVALSSRDEFEAITTWMQHWCSHLRATLPGIEQLYFWSNFNEICPDVDPLWIRSRISLL